MQRVLDVAETPRVLITDKLASYPDKEKVARHQTEPLLTLTWVKALWKIALSITTNSTIV